MRRGQRHLRPDPVPRAHLPATAFDGGGIQLYDARNVHVHHPRSEPAPAAVMR
jgi:hypothetical protein